MIQNMPEWLKHDTRFYTDDGNFLAGQMSNCLTLLRNLRKFSRCQIANMICMELNSTSPRRMVVDKLHARYIRLIRTEQMRELDKCLKQK